MYRIIICVLFVVSCKKEAALLSSGKDENLLVVRDNPSDPVDHAIYQFYQRTGIPLFYNDTIGRRQVGDSAGIPRYFYHRLAVVYSPAGIDTRLEYKLLKDKQQTLQFLDLLENDLLPRLPKSIYIPSILLVDSLRMANSSFSFLRASDISAYNGFNTVTIKTVVVDTMDTDEKNKYTTSVIALLAANKITTTQKDKLNSDFYSLTRKKAEPGLVYGQFFGSLSPDGSMTPEDFGFVYYYTFEGNIYTINEYEDLRTFLESVFYYSTAAFNEKYASYPLVIEKFTIIKTMVRALGFQFPD